LAVRFVIDQGMMNIRILIEVLKSKKEIVRRIFNVSPGNPSVLNFKTVPSFGYERDMRAAHFHKIGREEFPSSLVRKNHKGGGL
jgi:hypothetical protein